jgi:hypothetical protein
MELRKESKNFIGLGHTGLYVIHIQEAKLSAALALQERVTEK